MLSRGRIDIDNVYSLSDGILRLSLRKDTYEKAGLVGQPSRFGNTSGKKQPTRYSTLTPSNAQTQCSVPNDHIPYSGRN